MTRAADDAPLAPADVGATRSSPRKLLVGFLVVGIVVAVALPVEHLVDTISDDPVASAFDEDAWYSFSVARNVATGHGVTVDGHHVTSGFQPLWTLVLALPFVLHDHLKLALIVVGLMSLALWFAGAWLFADIVTRLVSPRWLSRVEVRLLAIFVFVFDQAVRGVYFNGLETGLYLTLLLGVASYLLRPAPADSLKTNVLFGVLLGLVALARFDGVMFVCAALFARAVLHRPSGRVRGAAISGAVALAFLAPWLAFNFWVAGTPSPQSGLATSATVVDYAPADIRIRATEDFLAAATMWPSIPVEWLSWNSMYILAVVIVIAELALLRLTAHPSIAGGKTSLAAVGLALSTLVAAYAAYSAAWFFYQRYFTPVKVALLIVGALAIVSVVDRIGRANRAAPMALVAVTVVVASAWVVGRLPPYVNEGHMGPEVRSLRYSNAFAGCGPVGMRESGRTGYEFPDRIVNLDGKMNVASLDAVREGRFLEYLDESGIRVLYYRDYETFSPEFAERFSIKRDPNSPRARIAIRTGYSCAAAGG